MAHAKLSECGAGGDRCSMHQVYLRVLSDNVVNQTKVFTLHCSQIFSLENEPPHKHGGDNRRRNARDVAGSANSSQIVCFHALLTSYREVAEYDRGFGSPPT